MKINVLIDVIDITFIIIGAVFVVAFIFIKICLSWHKEQKDVEIFNEIFLCTGYYLGKTYENVEAISDTNLLMRPAYEEFFARFEELRTVDDRRASRYSNTQ